MTPHALLSSSSSLSSQPGRASPAGQVPWSAREERTDGLPPLLGIAGYLAHGLVFLLLAIVTLACFGQLFWVFSSVNVVLALYSIYKASTRLHAYWRLSRRES
jgi:hypothetical protein